MHIRITRGAFKTPSAQTEPMPFKSERLGLGARHQHFLLKIHGWLLQCLRPSKVSRI